MISMRIGATALALTLAIAGISVSEARAEDADLEVTVSGIDPIRGQIAIAVFDNATGFKSGENPAASKMVAVQGDKVVVVLTGLEAGPHAIKVFHDVNGNGELDTNLVGMPTEPYGFSNDAKGRFGPPSFGEARFDLLPGANVHLITLEAS